MLDGTSIPTGPSNIHQEGFVERMEGRPLAQRSLQDTD